MEPSKNALLTLPGEIRNRIYSFAVETSDYTLTPPSKNAQRMSLVTYREFYNLTQVCRQLRAEFLPIYRRENTVHISHWHLRAYIGIFYPGPINTSTIVGNITLDACNRVSPSMWAPPADLLPILKICMNAPNLVIRRGLEYSTCDPTKSWSSKPNFLDALLDVKNDSILANYLMKAVKNVTVSVSGDLCLHVLGTYWEDWMEWNPSFSLLMLNRVYGAEDREAWCVKLGIERVPWEMRFLRVTS